MFKADLADMKRFERAMKEAPEKSQKTISEILNSLAFKTRKYDIKNISQSMVIRDTKFMAGSLRVEKANPNSSINSMMSIAGSVNRKGFSGWEEQQTGKIPKKRRGYTPGARDFNFRKKTVGKARLKPNQKFAKWSDFKYKNVKSENQKIGLFLKIMMDRKNKSGLKAEGKSFVLPKYHGFERGLYNYKDHKFTKYQEFDNANKPVKSNKWRTRSLNDLNSKNNIDKLWLNGIRRIMSHIKA